MLYYIHEDERCIDYCRNDDCDVRILVPYHVGSHSMKVGDLVICKYVEGKPIGVILNVRWRKGGNPGLTGSGRLRIYDVFVNAPAHQYRGTFPFQAHTVAAVNESR